METILEVQNLEKYYGKKGNVTKALDSVSFVIGKGEFVGIMGASGSGKTTLLNCISTIDSPSAGSIRIGGQELTVFKGDKLSEFRSRSLGFIFQDFNLLDTLNAYENIALALTIRNEPPSQIENKVRTISQKLNINNILYKYPYQLSGGEKQRVAAARAIVTQPSLILADEPTGALDSKSARMLLTTLETLNTDLGATILMVTHDAFSASYCSRILFIKDGVLFSELVRGTDTRKEFFDKIIEVVTFLGGDASNVL